MSKTATVHAQQKWEYMELTRKTEGFLMNDLNELGQTGWELVSVSMHKDAKSGLGQAQCWTAFLKRPHFPQSPAAQQQQAAAAAQQQQRQTATPKPAAKPEPEKPKPAKVAADDSPEVFEFKD